MNVNFFQAGLRGEGENGQKMIDMGVNAPVGNQPDEVEAMVLGGLKSVQKSRIPCQRTIQNGQIDPG
jgi:hypothetical protein